MNITEETAQRLIVALENLTEAIATNAPSTRGIAKTSAPSEGKGPHELALLDYLGKTRVTLQDAKCVALGLVGNREEKCGKLLELMRAKIVVKNAWGYVLADSPKGRHGSIRGAQSTHASDAAPSFDGEIDLEETV